MPEFDLSAQLLNSPSAKKWKRIGVKRRAGIVVPLFSVYSGASQGIGDFGDLKLLIDLCRKTYHSIIQLLPLNEVGGLFCPYDALSSFALEPAYLSLNLLSGVKNKGVVAQKIEGLKGAFLLRGASYVDYRIKKEKIRLLREIFLSADTRNSGELNGFLEVNKYWLKDFALFKIIKGLQGEKPWYEWEEKYKCRDASVLAELLKQHEGEFMFQAWLQWQLYLQLKEIKAYAAEKKVLINGDLPILVSRDSADAWSHPEFFKLHLASGAPPDMYCAKGQRWGMPPYNWKAVRKDGYLYIKEKLHYTDNFYDMLRIDHVVGLFRIWSIPYAEPVQNQGLNGFFDPLDERLWGPQGREILSMMLENTDMLLCAEDLGIIPEVCTQALLELGIPGKDVQRWAKDWKVRHDFLMPGEYRPLSVAMLSTHDTTDWAAWWENEAGTVDENMFLRKCAELHIDYQAVKPKLFDASLSRHGRLRWLKGIDSSRVLATVLGREEKEIKDFIDIYENTYGEKEQLWKQFGLNGPMRERSDGEIIREALKVTFNSSAVFSIQLILDWLSLAGLLTGDPYHYRINRPGTISPQNWSWVMPLSLEELFRHRICESMKDMLGSYGRNDI